MFAVLKAGAKLGAKAAKPMFKAAAKSGKTYAKQAARDISNDLKNNARQMAKNAKYGAKTMATNYLDSQKRRIYQTNRGAIYTNTSGGNRNYNPKPSYYNEPGSNVVKSIY